MNIMPHSTSDKHTNLKVKKIIIKQQTTKKPIELLNGRP